MLSWVEMNCTEIIRRSKTSKNPENCPHPPSTNLHDSRVLLAYNAVCVLKPVFTYAVYMCMYKFELPFYLELTTQYVLYFFELKILFEISPSFY